MFNDEDGKNTVAEKLAKELSENNIEVVVDDRKERPGFKFADADLIGWPYQLVIGKRSLENGNVELKNRKTGERTALALDDIVGKLVDLLKDKI